MLLGTVHFLRGRGGVGLVGFWGGHAKKNGIKGGPSQKKTEARGGHSKYFNILLYVELT